MTTIFSELTIFSSTLPINSITFLTDLYKPHDSSYNIEARKKIMPWEKSFDMDETVDKATEIFWAKGYETTSLSDLTKAMGINKGSFYNAFGSKKDLFLRSLLKYHREKHLAMLSRLKKKEDPQAAIEDLFGWLVHQSMQDKQRKGCLLVNTALDLPNHDPDIEDAIKKGFAELEGFFQEQIELGIAQGSITSKVDPVTATQGLVALVVGLRVLARGVFSAKQLLGIKSQAIDLIA